MSKYTNSQFILSELTREYYHSLMFSDEDPSQNVPAEMGDDDLRVKSFTLN